MGYREKINIYVPRDVGTRLDNDALMFEILKKDNRTINRNRFITLVLCGYYDDYLMERGKLYDRILSLISDPVISCSKKVQIATRVADAIAEQDVPKRKGKNPRCISYKPTAASDRVIDDIQNSAAETEFVAQFLCRMLISYARKPISERERIVFRDQVETIETALTKGRSITFTERWDERQRHEVMPYALACSQEEMYNYLVCEELNAETGNAVVKTYRLNRMTKLGSGTRTQPISNKNKHYCEMTVYTAPQYAINADGEICVKLNDKGTRLYNRIYYGRPKYSKIVDEGNYHYYYFTCSSDQVFHYFRRFEHGSVEVVSPQSERDRMICFHREALKPYLSDEEHPQDDTLSYDQ